MIIIALNDRYIDNENRERIKEIIGHLLDYTDSWGIYEEDGNLIGLNTDISVILLNPKYPYFDLAEQLDLRKDDILIEFITDTVHYTTTDESINAHLTEDYIEYLHQLKITYYISSHPKIVELKGNYE